MHMPRRSTESYRQPLVFPSETFESLALQLWCLGNAFQIHFVFILFHEPGYLVELQIPRCNVVFFLLKRSIAGHWRKKGSNQRQCNPCLVVNIMILPNPKYFLCEYLYSKSYEKQEHSKIQKTG